MKILGRWLPLVVVGATYIWSMVAIFHYRAQQLPPGVRVRLRISHWQLEAGARDGFRQLAAEYQKLHPDVFIEQEAIPESTYGQWSMTQLISGTAPDIMEYGMTPLSASYSGRYFLPLTSEIDQPNPYNTGTALAGESWRKTFKDGLRSGYFDELQTYLIVPMSMFTRRILYNRDLYRQLTGRDTPPRNYREFLAACEQIHQHRDTLGHPYVPIAASGYHIDMWDQTLCLPLTYAALRQLDFNRDGTAANQELYAAIATSRITMNDPVFTARFQMLRELLAYAPPGVAGLSRDEAVFLFAQQRAVFIVSGTWDMRGLLDQARGTFATGILPAPLPDRDDPEFGKILEGPVYEQTMVGLPLAITRTCPHPEVALDFLKFATSQHGNELLNRACGWVPIIRGAAMAPELAGFEARLDGVFGAMPTTLGGDTTVKWQQLLALFFVNQIDYPAMANEYETFYREHAPAEFAEQLRNRQRGSASDEQLLARLRVQAGCSTGAAVAENWVRYRQLETDRLLARELDMQWLAHFVADGPVNKIACAPYEFTPAALAHARQQAAEHR